MVLSETLWGERFNGDPSVLGRALTLSGNTYTIVGVMPRRFDETRRVWVSSRELLADGVAAWFPVGRLRAGATFEDAVVEVQQRAAAEVSADSTVFGGMGAVAIPLEQADRSMSTATLWVLTGAVGVILLLALTNLSTLYW